MTTKSTAADGRSRLNPNAPIFIPKAAYVEVEDFSPEWCFLSLHQEDDFISSGGDGCDYYTDGSHFLEPNAPKKEKELLIGRRMDVLLKKLNLDLDVSKSLKGRRGKPSMSPAKYCEKRAGNMRVNSKCAASRRIHQPR